jgi:DNA-binding SARP family transcriptional activator
MLVKRGDRTLTSADWIYLKGRELLLYLLCHPPRTKEQIGLALWPDASQVQVRSNFRVILHHLRLALGRPEWIVFENGHYAFNRSLPYWFDVEAFEANLCQAQALLADAPAQHLEAARPYLEEAAKLYQGDFLEAIVTGDWSQLRRDELQREYLGVLLALGQVFFVEGRYARAASIYRQVIVHDSYLEFAHRALMRCYAHLGERCRALRHYQDLRVHTRDELNSLPDPETTSLFEQLRRGEAI